ncbi:MULTISPECIES: ATP synthase F1 subunit delta [Parachlamydia]|jgi:F-type H+-transporting ATPase subunit delta|uniref:ATP synthase F1 subunit delta n=1 Tax=Parachlamydia TaxID=83551 RepID=UPI0001C177DD|nr:ATP synthase F1 subunit delta [Parachlamydia acanthamoebae]EFB40224.1 hypothetical protein pah_c221o012 [Parachlamydia acanthamoebae str. Hall's coccus]
MKRALSLQYAKALFRSTDALEQLNQWQSHLKAFEDMLKQSSDFQRFLISTQFSQEEKKRVLQKCYKDHFDLKFLDFIAYIVKQQKLSHLPLIIQEFSRMLNEKAGVLQAELVTAHPIDPKIIEDLKEKLKKAYQKEIKMDQQINPSIIGGGVLTIGNQMWDFSIKSRLKQMKQTLLTEIRQES